MADLQIFFRTAIPTSKSNPIVCKK